MMKTTTLAIAAAMALGASAHAQFDTDCNANGIADEIEIAQGFSDDCNGNGIPDECEYAGVRRLRQGPIAAYSPITFYLTVPEPVRSAVRINLEVRANLVGDSHLVIRLNDGEFVRLWETGGDGCSNLDYPFQYASVFVPIDTFNQAAASGAVTVSIEAIGAVDRLCEGGASALVSIHYIVDRSADCDTNGIWDVCDIIADPSFDCNGNGTIDTCEVALNTGYFNYDCDEDGVHDACQIAAQPVLDSNADWVLDEYQISLGDFTLDRIIDGADLAYVLESWGPSKKGAADLNQDGVVDAFELARVLGNWGRYPTGWGVVLDAAPNPRVVTSDAFRAGIEATGLPWRVRDNSSQVEMLLVPPGTFMMGCSPGWCSDDEIPVHEVTLTQAFYLGRYEVTQAQWTAVLGSNPSGFQYPSVDVPAADVPSRPVERVSWDMIQGFKAATDLRLPTEAEWEYACRSGTQTAFNLPPNGTNDGSLLGQLGWVCCISDSQTHPVGQKHANALGLHDMHGNVWEWVEDRYGYFPPDPQVDPPGPTNGSGRVLRGGSWYDQDFYCRTSARRAFLPNTVVNNAGLRVARTP